MEVSGRRRGPAQTQLPAQTNSLGELEYIPASLGLVMLSHLGNGAPDMYHHQPDSQGNCEDPKEESVR